VRERSRQKEREVGIAETSSLEAPAERDGGDGARAAAEGREGRGGGGGGDAELHALYSVPGFPPSPLLSFSVEADLVGL